MPTKAELRSRFDARQTEWKSLWDSKPDRDFTRDEAANLKSWNEEMADLSETLAQMDQLDSMSKGIAGGSPRSITGDKPAGSGFAKAFIDAGWDIETQPAVKVDMKSTFPAVDVWAPQRPGSIQRAGTDERFLWPLLPNMGIGNSTSIEDYRQGTRTLTGSVERALAATTDKATLDVTITHVVESPKTLAVVIEDIPTQVLKSIPTMEQFLNVEARYQIDQALDTHVYNQIIAATPPSGLTGANLIEQTRRAIAEMRLTGANPTALVVNPTAAADLDLFVQPGTADYMFPSRSAGVASPLWNLRVVERTSATLTEVPLLIDTSRLGMLYLGTISVLADPYTKMKQNLVDIRFEMNVLMHVRDANGAYLIEAETP